MGTIRIFIVAMLVIDVLFEQFLIHTVVYRVEHSCQRCILHFQMIIDITGACITIPFDVECVGSPDNIIICKKG